MARRSPVKVGIALVLLCAFSHAQADATCRTGCRGASQTFKLHDGTTYKYNFDSKVEISLSSAEGQKSVTEVKATVLLTQQPQCNQILRLQNVQIISSDGKKYSNVPDVEKAIRLNYHDGHLEDSICITPGDTQNSLNLKRAIASIFQANLKSGHETDVFGLCPTEVSQRKEGNVLVVQKSRNLNRCAHRESIGQEFLATAFDLNSEIKTSPLLNADYNAQLKIKNGILDQASIEENYIYVPFSVGNNGAKVSVETTLKYVGTAKDNTQAKVSQPRSIIFEDPHPVTSPNSNVNSILQAVKNTAKTIDITVGEKTATEFANLIRILRVSKRDDLLAVYSQVRAGVGFADKETGRRIFLDALLRAGNGDNVEVALELLRNKQLTEIEQNLVYIGLSVVRHPTEGSLTAAAVLLNQPDLPRNAYLGIGSLVGRYCRLHSCEKVDAVNKLVQKLVQKLGNGKAVNRQQENDIIFVLKALGNTNHLNDNILPKITAIAQDKKAANRLRVTALEAYLADPCKDKLRDSALAILKDIQQDSEVRIKAYLVLAQCPNSKVGNAIKALLEHEPSYQVGGFIVSHIRNIRASANPDKALAKQFLGFINVPNRFPFDLRKYSANNEFSYTIDTLGIANSVESNIIYSQKSFLPRSSSFNLTAEVFGHSFNFLEVETRQENLDRLLEHYLGPKGLLRSHNLQDLWKSKQETATNLVNELKQKLEKTLRSRRDVTKAEIDHIGKQVQIKTNELNNDLDLDLSIKTFGSEILFLNINDDVQKWTPEALIDKIIDCLNKGLDKLKNFEETLRSNLLLLDAEFAYPTSAGFPLRLGLEGSANTLLKASGAIDVKALLNNQDTTVKISLIPSTNIEIAGRLTIDTLLVESGLKVVSTLHTSSGGDLIVNIGSNSLDVKFALPVENQNLLSAKHEIVFQNREWGLAEKLTKLKFAQSKDFSICLDQLNDFIGLTFCGEFNGPNLQGEKVPILPFPLSGDATVSATIERGDLAHYHYRHLVYDKNQIGAELEIEAVGKSGNKKVNLGVKIVPNLLKITLTSPITTASLEGRITLTNSEKSISLQLLQDQNEYFGKLGVGVQGDEKRAVYRPILQYKTPENSALQVPPYHVEGEVIAEHKSPDVSTYTFNNVRIVIPDKKTVNLNGKLGTEPETVFADLTLSDGSNSASFRGKIRANPNLLKYNAEIKNSLNPSANIHLKGELSRSGDEAKHFFQVAHGGDFSDKNNILTLENSLKVRRDKDYLFATKNELKYPAAAADFEFDLELKPKAVKYDLDIEYANFKLGSELDYESDKKKEGDIKLEFEIWGLNNRLKLKVKRQVNGDISQIENSLDVNGRRIEVNGKVRHHVKPQDIDVGSDLIIKLPTHNAPLHIVNHLKLNANDIDAAHKVTSGNQVFVDVFLKANKVGNANGSIKVNLKGRLVITGQVKATKGVGTGDIIIELPSVKRSAKIDGNFAIQDPKYNILINIYPVFNQDKTKKITASTHSTITPHSIDSKNLFDIFGSKLEANVKGSQQGDVQNGKVNGEAELTLPNGHYFAGKLNRDVKNINGVINGNAFASLEHRSNKNQPGSKASVKALIKNTNPVENIYDVQYDFAAERTNGQNLNADLHLKRQPQGDVTILQITNKISGSILESPIETSIRSTLKGLSGSYEGKTSYKPVGSLAVNGKYDSGPGKICSGDVNIEASSTSQALRTLKVSVSGSVADSNNVDLKWESSIYADAPKGVIIDLSGTGVVQSGDQDGRVKLSIKSGKNEPYAVDATLKENGKKEYRLDVQLATPIENLKNSRLQVHSKRNEDDTRIQSDVVLTVEGKTWTSNTDLVLSDIAPSLDFKVKDPAGKLRQILVKISNLSERQIAGQIKLVNQEKNFLLEGSIDANVESIDDFHIKITANSPALKIDKYMIEAQNKPVKAGRRIQVTAKSGNKNILAGSTSYTAREEQGKLIIEGSGSFKVKDETKGANFKFIKQNLVQAKNGETGIEISFDGGLGNKAIDAELKITNKQFRILNSYCEEKKQCAHVEIDVKTISDDARSFHQEVEIAIDLRKLGLSHEFGLKAVSKREGATVGDHTVEVHLQNQENSKYQVELYLHANKAGITVETPKRTIVLNGDLYTAESKEDIHYVGGLSLYPDKKHQPQQKTNLLVSATLDVKGNALVAEVKFTDPRLRNPLSVSLDAKVAEEGTESVTLILDVFSQPNQKLTFELKNNDKLLKNVPVFNYLHITSPGLGIDIKIDEHILVNFDQKIINYNQGIKYIVGSSNYNSELSYKATPSSADVLLIILNKEIYRASAKLQISDQQQVVDNEFSYLGNKPLVGHLEIKNLNTLKYTLALKENPNDKLQVNAGLIPGQIADVRAEIIKGGAKQELGHASVKLDDANFLKFDYNVISSNVDAFLKKIQGHIDKDGERVQQLSDESYKIIQQEVKHLDDLTKKASPNLAPIRQYYVDEAQKIKEEILQDKSIKEISELLYNVFSAISQAVGNSIANFSELVENIAQTLQNTFGTIIETVNKDILPKLKEVYDKLLQASAGIANSIGQIITNITAKLAEIAEAYRPELEQLVKVFAELGQDVLQAGIRVWETIKTVIVDQWQEIYNEIKQIPALEQLRAEYERFIQHGLPGPEVIAGTVKDIISTLKDIAPTQELKDLIQAIGDYVNLKLTNQKVDDDAAINKIIKAAITAGKQIINIIRGGEEAPDLEKVNLPIPGSILNNLPKLATIRFSPLSYILREEGSLPNDFLLSLVNTPRNLVPPFPLYGIVAQGQHIFTFDGKHLTFPGKCNYLLARDAVDGNFTVAGTYANGILTAISLTQGPNTITLRKGGQILLNNAPSEFPVRKSTIAAFRDTEKIVLISDYGVRVVCEPQLILCSVSTSGFYHGKLRGLLGNGNNEPYDDFTLPSGKIVSAESEFGNGYKLSSGCPAVQTVSHAGHHPTPSCDKLFGWESTLSLCYPFVDVANFKLACEHGVASGVKDTEEAIAAAYTAACYQHGIPIKLPAEFVKCINGDTSIAVGDKFSVKTPGKAADIVLLVNTNKENEQIYKEYVQPLVQQLTSELNSKGINDLEFHLVAYGGENQWPSHITVNNGKLTFKGKAPNLKFTDNPSLDKADSGCKYIDGLLTILHEIGYDIQLAAGLDLQSRTYYEGLQYPFRAHAIKSIIAVVQKPCDVGRLYPLQVLRAALLRENTINLNLITPIARGGAKADAKNIVGFNSRDVPAIGATKNKVKSYPDLGKLLEYNDYCIDFTIQNNGNVFVADHFLLQPKNTRRQFIQLTSHTIVNQLIGTEEGFDCECKYSGPFSAKSVCKLAYSKEKAPARKAGTKS